MNPRTLVNLGNYDAFIERAINGRPASDTFRRDGRISPDAEWSGTRTFQDAADLLTRGWKEGSERIGKTAASLHGGITVRHESVYDVSGDEVDVGRFLANEPECMRSFELREFEGCGAVVRVVFGLFWSAGIGGTAIFNRGAAVLRMIDALENSGRRVELIGDYGVSNQEKTKTLHAYFVAKESGQPVEIDRLAFLMCHQASYRRIGFSALETLQEGKHFGMWGGYYGSPTDDKLYPDGADAVQVPGMNLNAINWNDSAAVDSWINEVLKKNGVEIEATA